MLSDASDSRSRGKSAVWGGSSSNISNIQSRLNQMSDDEEAAVVDDNEHVRQDRCSFLSASFFDEFFSDEYQCDSSPG